MIAQQLTAFGASAGLAILFGWALEGWSEKAPPTPCPTGRFLVDPGNGQLVEGASTGSIDSITVDEQGRIAIGSGCLAVAGRITAKRHFTKVTAKWKACGHAGASHLKAKIGSPDCGVMKGSFKSKGGKAKPFTVRRSTCGDGVVDGAGGEQCERGMDGCAAGIACTAACTCESPTTTLVPPTTSSIITMTTSTTTVTASSTTTIGTTTTIATPTTSVTTTTARPCGPLPYPFACAGACPVGLFCNGRLEVFTNQWVCECQPDLTTTTSEPPACGASTPTCYGTCASGQVCRPVPRLGLCECTFVPTTTTIP